MPPACSIHAEFAKISSRPGKQVHLLLIPVDITNIEELHAFVAANIDQHRDGARFINLRELTLDRPPLFSREQTRRTQNDTDK